MKHIHSVFAHPGSDSLNLAMQQLTQRVAKRCQCHVEESDLYRMYECAQPAVQPFGVTRTAADNEKIKQEQEKILNSQLTILQFPVYWFSVPGIMKNYWEQVLEPGFAYPGKFQDSPLSDGRKILFSMTTQSSEQDYRYGGQNGTISQNMFHLSTAFRFVGYEVLEPFVIYGVMDKSRTVIAKELEAFEAYLSRFLKGEC